MKRALVVSKETVDLTVAFNFFKPPSEKNGWLFFIYNMKVNDKVSKRGYTSIGIILEIKENEYGTCCKIKWDEGYLNRERPKWCKKEELMTLTTE